MSRSLAGLAALLLLAATATHGQSITAGDAALAQFDLDAALSHYQAAHRAAPDNYEATWKLCRALVDKATLTADKQPKKQLLVEAEQLARAAVKLKPQEATAHTYLAISVGQLALFAGGKRKVELSNEVRAEAERALTINAKDDLAHHTLAIWHREMSELNWVLRKFAETLYGKFPAASIEAAIQHLEQAVELMPATVAHRTELGLTYLAAGRKEKARMQLEKAISMPQSWVTDEHYRAIAKQHYRRTTDT